MVAKLILKKPLQDNQNYLSIDCIDTDNSDISKEELANATTLTKVLNDIGIPAEIWVQIKPVTLYVRIPHKELFLYVKAKVHKKYYAVGCLESFPLYTNWEDILERPPNYMGALSKKKIKSWINYYETAWTILTEKSIERTKYIDAFLNFTKHYNSGGSKHSGWVQNQYFHLKYNIDVKTGKINQTIRALKEPLETFALGNI